MHKKYYNYTSYCMDVQKNNLQKKQAVKQISDELFNKIQNDKSTKIIEYPQHKEAYDYVCSLRPDIDIKSIKIYQCDISKLRKIIDKSVKGFYLINKKIVVISNDYQKSCSKNVENYDKIEDVKYTIDEVIVHELLHFVSHSGGMLSSELFEEEFAYGNSVGYFKQKGYSNDDIIYQKLASYLMSAMPKDVRKKILYDSLAERGYSIKEYESFLLDKRKRILKNINSIIEKHMKKEIYDLGNKFIDIHCNSVKKVVSEEKKDSPFDMIDL